MGLLERMTDELERKELVFAPAAGLLHGVVSVHEQNFRWVRPYRFSDEQLRALGSVVAWHPGLYRQMGSTTSGICVEFDTDAREVVLEVRVDAEPKGTRAVLDVIDAADGGDPRPHDGLSADVDGRHLPCVMPGQGEELVSFSLVGDDPHEALGIRPLPGMAPTHHVRIWLPCLRSCIVRDLYCDGSFLRPVPHREVLLVLGDSVAQGFVADDPALAWPSLMATRLGLDLVNQGLGGQVFQPGSLFGLAGMVKVGRVVVAYGGTYRQEPCMARRVSRDVRSYLAEVDRLWPDVPTQVLTPLWHDEDASATHGMSCFAQVPELIATHAAGHDHMTLVDGLELLEHDPSLFADGSDHPNAKGMRQIATRLTTIIRIPGLRPRSVGRRRPRKELPPALPEEGVPTLPLPLSELA